LSKDSRRAVWQRVLYVEAFDLAGALGGPGAGAVESEALRRTQGTQGSRHR